MPQALFAWLLEAVFSQIFLFKSRHFPKNGKTLNPGTAVVGYHTAFKIERAKTFAQFLKIVFRGVGVRRFP